MLKQGVRYGIQAIKVPDSYVNYENCGLEQEKKLYKDFHY